MELQIALPLDHGFLRRKCPHCKREFKWHDRPTDAHPNDTPEPPFYYCPYCGEPASTDSWWTDEQIEYVEQTAAGPALREIEDELHAITKKASNSFIKFSVDRATAPPAPEPLVEANDMAAVESPCHPREPVKIMEDWTTALHCLVCGARFSSG